MIIEFIFLNQTVLTHVFHKSKQNKLQKLEKEENLMIF